MKISTILILVSLLAVLLPGEAAMAQQCGPGCPACSGKTIGELQSPTKIVGSGLFIPEGNEETAVYQLRYGVLPWADLGIGYAHKSEEVIWSLRMQPVDEDRDGWRPSLIVGTGSIQTGGNDQSVFIQLAKTLEIVDGRLGVSLAGGFATDLPDLEEDWALGTASLILFDRASPFYTYDGINSHLGLSYFATEWLTLSGYSLEMETAALSVQIQWSIGKDMPTSGGID